MVHLMERFDVLIVGAGLSGIGAAVHLKDKCPDRSFVLLEGRNEIGGTWDLFRYPGIRSDSDMHTLGFEFKPWSAEKSIADGPSIMKYLNETCDEYGVRQHIRLGHKVVAANWDTANASWIVDVERAGERMQIACGYLYMCAGYYSYENGYVPEFEGVDSFRGQLIHPQKWPEDLDYTGKQVVVVGSGATAITVVPAMATKAAHVTMLQRTPTYVAARPDTDKFANFLRKILPAKTAYAVTRKKNTFMQQFIYGKTRTAPHVVKKKLLDAVREELGPDYDVEKHFTPPYNPWDQRLCLVTNGDLFKGIREGRIEVVTDTISNFDATGINLNSGAHLDADIIVMATGLQLLTAPGDLKFTVDGAPLEFSKAWTYKGFAYSDVPNMCSTFGYINASWTLRADLISTYVCRLLNEMKKSGTTICTPRLRPSDERMPSRPWIDQFSAGYMQRVMDQMPRQSDREPWINPQNYKRDREMFRFGELRDGVMQFTNPYISLG